MDKTNSLLTRLAWALFFCLLCSARAALPASNTFAQIELVEGLVTIIDENGESRIPHVDDTIRQGDTIVTGRDGELQARTEDHGIIAVRPNTRMKVEAYRANGDGNDKSVISLLEGTYRSITGWIGKLYPNNYQIKTPSAAITVRGTDHEPSYIPERGAGETPIAPPGTYDKVNSGSTVIRNAGGEVIVHPDQAGFAPHDSKAPQILKSVPHFYRPGRNENRIEQRRPELEKELLHRHAEKRSEIRRQQLEIKKHRPRHHPKPRPRPRLRPRFQPRPRLR